MSQKKVGESLPATALPNLDLGTVILKFTISWTRDSSSVGLGWSPKPYFKSFGSGYIVSAPEFILSEMYEILPGYSSLYLKKFPFVNSSLKHSGPTSFYQKKCQSFFYLYWPCIHQVFIILCLHYLLASLPDSAWISWYLWLLTQHMAHVADRHWLINWLVRK